MLLQTSLAALAGIASHLLFFIHGEHHMKAPLIFRIYLGVFAVLVFSQVKYDTRDLFEGTSYAVLIATCYAVSLLSSIVIYRTLFHRLRRFPTPFLAGVSKFWHVARVVDSQNHLLLDRLHEKYGDFIRTGPTEVTIFCPEILSSVDGPGNKCTKAVWYDFLLPEVAMNTTRDKKEHDQRRRIWDHGFTSKSLQNYQDRITTYGEQLERHIAASTGEPVDVSTWFYFFSFDVMGDFAFAKSFNMLRDEKWHYAVIMLRKALTLLGPLSPVPWLAQLAFSFPKIPIVRDWKRMVSWSAERMGERIEVEVEKPDISSWLIDASRKNNSIKRDMNWLNGDSIALIVAGSDTVAPTLVYIFYRLASDPGQVDKLRAEMKGSHSIYDSKALTTLGHLNGVINEALRLHPPVPTGGYRETPPEGLTVAGKFIPGYTTVVAPRYTIGRLASCFEQPEDFVPERWYSKPEMVKDKRAFAPFSIGRYSCVGKNLALSELRFVTALLVSKYDIAFAPGEAGIRVWKNMKDQFTAAPGKLELVFHARK